MVVGALATNADCAMQRHGDVQIEKSTISKRKRYQMKFKSYHRGSYDS